MRGEDELWLDAETMRRFGYRTVDMLVEHLSGVRDAELLTRATREELEARLLAPAPEHPTGFEELLARIRDDVLRFTARQDHPGYLAYIPSAGTWPGALGDLIASAANLYVGSWLDGAGPTQLELTVIDWFSRWLGYPEEASGLLVSGGSAANMTALACARETLVGAMSPHVVAYCSQQSHSSTARAARVLGFRPDQLRVLPVDRRARLRVDLLGEAIDADLRAGRHPLFVSANAGATSTGAIDPLPELAGLCRERGIWLHVDAAYGGFAALTARGAAELAGIQLADSVTLDPHKWLFQPIECGAVLVRDGSLLQRAFEMAPDYLGDLEARGREVNLSDRGLQLTRGARAVKIWLSVHTFGLDAFRRAIDRALDLAEHAERRIEASSELELMGARSLGIVCFRRTFGGETDEALLARWNARLAAELERTGRVLLSSTRLDGRYALRLAIVSHATQLEDVDWVLDRIESADVDRAPARQAGEEEPPRESPLEAGWVGRGAVDPAELREVPLFSALGAGRLEELARQAWLAEAGAGETIVARWDPSRDFYVIRAGRVEIRDGSGEVVAEAGPGEFFGEIAALDWSGAHFAYSRLATVRALEPVRLLVVPPGALNRLAGAEPSVGEPLRAALRQRLGRL